MGARHASSGGDYVYVNPPKVGVPSWGELVDQGAQGVILGEIGEKCMFFIMPTAF